MQNMPDILIEETQIFGERSFYSDYRQLSWRDQTLRHIGEHVTKAGFKLVEYEEGSVGDRILDEEVIPDLAIYRTQIINLLKINPNEIDWDTHNGKEDKLPQSILWAAGMINRYIEPAEHIGPARHSRTSSDSLIAASVRLNFVSSLLANQRGLNLVDIQRKRMKR